MLDLTSLAAVSVETSNTFILTAVLLTLAVVYLASKLGGGLCARIGLPEVLGELLGGVLVGISALHVVIFPEQGVTAADSSIIGLLELTSDLTEQGAGVVFQTQAAIIDLLSEIGVVVLLLEVGLACNLDELIKIGPKAALVAIAGVAAPFAIGAMGLVYIFGVAPIPAVFVGAALTATSIGITAKVLSQLGKIATTEGQIIIGAAVLDDILGIILLAVVASLAKTGEVDVSNIIYLLVVASLFLGGAILLGRQYSNFLVRTFGDNQGQLLVSALIFALLMSYLASAIGLEALLGAFAAGLILGETTKHKELQQQITPLAYALVPIFFVSVGARTNIGVLNPLLPENRQSLVIALFLAVAAIVSQLAAGYVLPAKDNLNRLAIGIGMIPRGEVALVFAGMGLSSGVLSESLNVSIVVMVIMTTFIAPPLVKWAMSDERFPPIPLDPADPTDDSDNPGDTHTSESLENQGANV
jgi:Kef-type K+ transport system membrane component KefB